VLKLIEISERPLLSKQRPLGYRFHNRWLSVVRAIIGYGREASDEGKPMMGLGSWPNIIDHGLVVVFCGVNPSPKAVETGHGFVSPTNRFWRALHLAGFSPELLTPGQDSSLLQFGCGLVSAVARPTRRANELTRAELLAAGAALRTKVELFGPKWIAFLGKAPYSAIASQRSVIWGLQTDAFASARAWVLPDPSGLNRIRLPELVDAYRELRVAAAADFRKFECASMIHRQLGHTPNRPQS
jgi:double-stranded uracil-DNA glycosylase